MTGTPSDSRDQLANPQAILVVVGAHLRAEIGDRPLAYKIREQISAWADDHATTLSEPIVAIVCCDVWYLNNDILHGHPVISVGGPGVNALSAFFSDKLETVLVRDDKLIVQLDPEFVDLRSCVWGTDHDLTVEAVELFSRRYMEEYLRAVATQVEP